MTWDATALEALETRTEALERRADALRERASRLAERLDATSADALTALQRLEGLDDAVKAAIDPQTARARAEDLVEEHLQALAERVRGLSEQIALLPERIARIADEDRLDELRESLRLFSKAALEAPGVMLDYVENTVNGEVLAPRLQHLQEQAERADALAEEAAQAISERFEALAGALVEASTRIGQRHQDWLDELEGRWEERAAELSGQLSTHVVDLRARGEALIAKLDRMVSDVGAAIDGMADLREVLEDSTGQTQVGLSVVTGLIEEVAGLFEEVK